MRQLIAGAVVTGGLATVALSLGAGLTTAQPGHPGPGVPWPGPAVVEPARSDIPWQERGGYDRAVRDHRPFQYQGQWVNPSFDPARQGWGFWLGPVWIPLI